MNYLAPKRLVGYAMAAVFLLIAGWGGKGDLRDLQEWLWLQNAVTVDAEILGYTHEYISTAESRRRVTTFSYVYSFSDQEYRRTTRHLGPFVDHRAEAARLIAAADRGAFVPCYVDPRHASMGLLSRNTRLAYIAMGIAFPAGFALCAICILWSCFSKRYAHQFS